MEVSVVEHSVPFLRIPEEDERLLKAPIEGVYRNFTSGLVSEHSTIAWMRERGLGWSGSIPGLSLATVLSFRFF
jgi:hypothetical protein